MRAILCVAMLALLIVATSAEDVELYSDKYDYIDADEILANDRLREQYYNCFMDISPCSTADQTFFKGNFADSIATNCKRCTEKQKVNLDKMADWFTKNQPDKWEAFVAKFLKEAKEKNAER